MRWLLVFAVTALGLMAATVGYLWLLGPGEAMALGLHGWLALTLAIVLTAALAVALMALLFHSSRSGHDDDVHTPDDPRA